MESDSFTSLLEVMNGGDMKKFKQLTELSPNSIYLIDEACRSGNIEAVEHLVSKGATHMNGLPSAIRLGHISVVKFLLSKNISKGDLDFCLTKAARVGNMDMIKLLEDKGADNYDGSLYQACYNGNMDIILHFIEKGATQFDNALSCACKAKDGNIEVIKLIIYNLKGTKYINESIIDCYNTRYYNNLVVLLSYKGYIVSDKIRIPDEYIYQLYKLKVKHSEEYEKQYIKLQTADNILKKNLSKVLPSDVLNIIKEY